MRNLAFHDMNQNRIWLAVTVPAADFLASAQHASPRRDRLRRAKTGCGCGSSPPPAGSSALPPRALHIDPTRLWAEMIITADGPTLHVPSGSLTTSQTQQPGPGAPAEPR